VAKLAAFTGNGSLGQAALSEECLSGDWFERRAIYAINSHNLGFAGRENCRVIVDLADDEVEDSRLVIALHRNRVYAGRLLRDRARPELVGLGSEAENPLKRAPSLLLPTEEVTLLKIVGVLFDQQATYSRDPEEAILVTGCDLIGKIEIAFRVAGDSALPLALPGQTVLGGPVVKAHELQAMKGQLVALATSEGEEAAFFKRVGEAIPGLAHLRQFESVGGLGESMLVATEETEGAFAGLPRMLSARRVLGILYDPR
jgi:hypothetical protein